jgi:hypothetical protein
MPASPGGACCEADAGFGNSSKGFRAGFQDAPRFLASASRAWRTRYGPQRSQIPLGRGMRRSHQTHLPTVFDLRLTSGFLLRWCCCSAQAASGEPLRGRNSASARFGYKGFSAPSVFAASSMRGGTPAAARGFQAASFRPLGRKRQSAAAPFVWVR